MKTTALIFLALLFTTILLFGLLGPRPDMVSKTEYLKLQDSIEALQIQQIYAQDGIEALKDSIVVLNDSIEDLLVRPLMTSEQFLQLYKYERLEKYFDICEKNPSQKKYLWGWMRRVFGHQ